jgi:pimeloyl-ACP methyl ester carboxylesterase
MLHNEEKGSGQPLVTVHGAWADGRHWYRFADELSDGFRVVVYDRRGHGRSGGRHEGLARDVDDLVGLFEWLEAPTHVVAGSFGASVALRAAAERPDRVLSLAVHEPALSGLLGGAPQPPDQIPPPRAFAEASLGDGWWERLSDDERAGFEDNGQVWLDELSDTEAATLDLESLGALHSPVLVTIGGASPDFWQRIAAALTDALPNAIVDSVLGAGHLPHLTHARAYAEMVGDFASAAAAPR